MTTLARIEKRICVGLPARVIVADSRVDAREIRPRASSQKVYIPMPAYNTNEILFIHRFFLSNPGL